MNISTQINGTLETLVDRLRAKLKADPRYCHRRLTNADMAKEALALWCEAEGIEVTAKDGDGFDGQ